MKKSKRLKAALTKVEHMKEYSLRDGIEAALSMATAKFNESIDIVARLGVDPTKGDQVVRVTLSMPHGLGKEVRVAALVADEKIEEAKKAGADIASNEDLIEAIKAKEINFDVLVTTPDMMPKIAPLARILGPIGKMPNPKTNTVTPDVPAAIKSQKQGQLAVRVDKQANLHAMVGKSDFTVDKLEDNIRAFVKEVIKAKPETSKGVYLKHVYLAPSMGPSVKLSVSDLTN